MISVKPTDPKERIEIVPNGIDLFEYTSRPPKGFFKIKFQIADDERIVLYLGRLHKSKGLDLLIHAFSIVLGNASNVRLVLVGPDDGYAKTLLGLISELKIEENVLLTGFIPKKDNK